MGEHRQARTLGRRGPGSVACFSIASYYDTSSSMVYGRLLVMTNSREGLTAFLVLLAFIVLTVGGHGDAHAVAIPQEVKKVVAFVYVDNNAGHPQAIGTAFFIAVPSKSNKDAMYVYLVTAKHVLAAQPNGPFRPKVSLRLDKLKGGTQIFDLPLIKDGSQKNVFVHPDPTVDLVVIPVVVPIDVVDLKVLPLDWVPSQEEFKTLGIAEGSDVFFTGLFTAHVGEQRNYPIVRFGHIAMLPDEKVRWDGALMDLYLIESSSYGGNSGSPVFLYLGADRTPGSLVVGPPILRLAGVMMGAFSIGVPVQVQTAESMLSYSNMGIAAVVPSYHLREIILSDELAKLRR